MSKTILYTCDICGEKRTGLEQVSGRRLEFYGLHFITNSQFKLQAPNSECGKHICENCWKQLKKIMENEENDKNNN